MSMPCKVCSEYRDHNIMEHIYKLEASVEALVVIVTALRERKQDDQN